MRKMTAVWTMAALLAAALSAGCGQNAPAAALPSEVPAPDAEAPAAEAEAAESENAPEEAEAASSEEEDAAARCAELIDSIYVQEWTEDTPDLCAQAKAAWDALTPEQRETVEGEFADPDYFGRDTGDASQDDPLNADGIGEKELLVVSFGTSFNESRAMDIGGIEKKLQEENPDWSVRRAFTAQTIINHVLARDGEGIDNVEQALERAVSCGVRDLVVQPTHLMHGAEYDELVKTLEKYEENFESVRIAQPLLGDAGADAKSVNDDKKAVAQAVTAEAAAKAGFASIEDAAKEKTAFVLLGHGTSHAARITYNQMQAQMETSYPNVFIGTVEGEPEDTACEAVIEKVREAGYERIVLRPLMVVAGDHANNDMAGEDEDSWKSMMEAAGCFSSVECQIEGLGRIDAIREIYAAHTRAVIGGGAEEAGEEADAEKASDSALEDGTYEAFFETDSSMFRVSEANDGKGVLTVEDGKMTIHVSLGSKNILNLYPGVAKDAAAEGAELLKPTTDTVTYSDGTREEVYGFDIPVPALDQEFDLALIGKKGKWYDHKVTVRLP